MGIDNITLGIDSTVRDALAKALANQLIKHVEKEKALPLYFNSPRSGYSLVEVWQLFQACLSGADPEYLDLFGPTKPEQAATESIKTSAEEIREAACLLKVDYSVPASVIVGDQRVNAAGFLYLMAKAIESDSTRIEGVSLDMFQAGTKARHEHFQDVVKNWTVFSKGTDDELPLLQLWTYKPAYYAKADRAFQKTISVKADSHGQPKAKIKRKQSRPAPEAPSPW